MEAQADFLFNSGVVEGERRVLEWLAGQGMDQTNGE